MNSQSKWEVGAGGRSQADWKQLLALVHQGTSPHRVAALPYKTRRSKGDTHTAGRILITAGSFTTHCITATTYTWLLKTLQDLSDTDASGVPMLKVIQQF